MKFIGIYLLLMLRLWGETAITSVDFNAVPEGETITFNGSGFSSATSVSFIFSGLNTASENVTVIDDSTLEVTYDAWQPSREHIAFVRTTEGSTFTLPVGDDRFGDPNVYEFTGTGVLEQFNGSNILPSYVIAKAGSVITSVDHLSLDVLYLEPGATLQRLPQETFGLTIFAADGAVIDFRDFQGDDFQGITVYYSTNTTIIGSVPTNDEFSISVFEELPSISYSPNIGTFTEAGRLSLVANGNGTIMSSKTDNFLGADETFTLNAVPGDGGAFSHWNINSSRNGSSTSTDLSVEITTDRFVVDNITATATFTEGIQINTSSTIGGSVTKSPDLAAYEAGSSVDIVAVADAGYEFVGWAYGSASSAPELTITANMSGDYIAIFRELEPTRSIEIGSVDFNAIPEGDTITYSGSGFTGATDVNFIFSSQNTASENVTVVDDSTLEVSYDAHQTSREHIAFVRATEGSTFTLPVGNDRFGPNVHEFTGNGRLEQFNGADVVPSYVIAKAGSVITSIDHSSLDVLYLEPGATLQAVPDDATGLVIFAADNSVLDFRNYGGESFNLTEVYYSPNTHILGDVPVVDSIYSGSIFEEVASIHYSEGIGTFTEAGRLSLVVNGSGEITSSKDSSFIGEAETFTLTAVPSESSVFSHWNISSSRNGNSTSTELSIEITSDSHTVDNITATATFTDSIQLNTIATRGGSVSKTPDLANYEAGESVEIRAIAEEGYVFVGWAYGSQSNSSTLTEIATASREYVAIFKEVAPVVNTLISSVDRNALPVGETVTFTGSGFEGASDVHFIYSSLSGSSSENVVVQNDNSLQASFDTRDSVRDSIAFIRTSQGSTFTLPEGNDRFGRSNVYDFTGRGELVSFTGGAIIPPYVVAKSGSVITNIDNFSLRVLYLEPGATLQSIPEDSFNLTIFAADNSVIDFRGFEGGSLSGITIFYSPDTQVLGEVPTFDSILASTSVEQISSINYSPGIGTFTSACSLDIEVFGPGSVTVSPVKEFYEVGETVQLTATPDSNAFFIRWLNDITSLEETFIFTINRDCSIAARFSDRPDFFTNWRTQFFTEQEISDPTIVGLDQDPDGDGVSNVAEYAFGTDPSVADQGDGVSVAEIDGSTNTIQISYKRPQNASDLFYQPLISQDLAIWSDGEDDTLLFSYTEIDHTEVDENLEEVTYEVTFTQDIPKSLYFRITAELQ